MVHTFQFEPDSPSQVVLGSGGRIVLPASVRKELGIAPGDLLSLRVKDGLITLESRRTKLERIQREVLAERTSTGSAVDALIAERREEARRELENR